ncbi:MAG: zinc-dependent metalloproteinase lipoprotein [Rikenellaceae bacterium]
MQARLISLLFIISLLFSCADKDSYLELSQSTFKLDNVETTLIIEISTDEDWTTINSNDWCVLDQTSGFGDATLEITVSANDSGEDRAAEIFVKSGINYQRISISQYSEFDDTQFEIPVIFHILYKNSLNSSQYVKSSWIEEILEEANSLFSSTTDMNVTFVLPTEDSNGNALTEAGINRIKIDDSEIDYSEFMKGEYSAVGADDLWSLTSYINVFVYTFEQVSGSGTVLGVSHLPYTVSDYPLDGLVVGDYYINQSYTTTYPHCISINNDYIYSRSDDDTYVSTDITVTLAHELGHYVGLLHAFEEDDTPTDYCDDTPNYSRTDYISWLSGLTWSNMSYSLDYLSQRTATDGSTFTARNIMDYYYCWSDTFTSDQRTRVRHVLNYSPLMPGPKRNSTKSAPANAVRPEPKFVECVECVDGHRH